MERWSNEPTSVALQTYYSTIPLLQCLKVVQRDPSTALRSARDDRGLMNIPFAFEGTLRQIWRSLASRRAR
jgi:hypothetical protein